MSIRCCGRSASWSFGSLSVAGAGCIWRWIDGSWLRSRSSSRRDWGRRLRGLQLSAGDLWELDRREAKGQRVFDDVSPQQGLGLLQPSA
jgi:hypothetical protein